jgi:hypothetical protein
VKNSQTGDRLIALFLLGALLLSPPLLAIFRVDALVFGIPLLFLYLFFAWALLIVLLALAVERGRRRDPVPNPPLPATPED